MKHTPGPWIADDNEGFGAWHIWSGMTPTGSGTPGPLVATIVGDSAETDANASLIAAAPELLEAAKAYMAMIEHPETKITRVGGPDPVKSVNDMLAAIAKAEGK
jgi:hypothetical protein